MAGVPHRCSDADTIDRASGWPGGCAYGWMAGGGLKRDRVNNRRCAGNKQRTASPNVGIPTTSRGDW